MKEDCPSATAQRVAMYRAAHQVLDNPTVFDNPLEFRILGMKDVPMPSSDPGWSDQTPFSENYGENYGDTYLIHQP